MTVAFEPYPMSAVDSLTDAGESTTTEAFGPVLIVDVTTAQTVVERAVRTVGRGAADCYAFGLQLDGGCVLEQGGRQVQLRPDDLAIYDTARPHRLQLDDAARIALAVFPRALVRLPEKCLAQLMAVRLPGDNGVGALVATLMRGLAGEMSSANPLVAAHVGDAVVDLVTAVLAAQLPAPHRGRRGHRALAAAALHYIDNHLQDADLCAKVIADAHFVSVRCLQEAFEGEGMSVSALIRSRRMHRCRRDLVDPRCQHLSIAHIGHRWGFPDPAHFSRLFRSAYGHSPRQFRKDHLGT